MKSLTKQPREVSRTTVSANRNFSVECVKRKHWDIAAKRYTPEPIETFEIFSELEQKYIGGSFKSKSEAIAYAKANVKKKQSTAAETPNTDPIAPVSETVSTNASANESTSDVTAEPQNNGKDKPDASVDNISFSPQRSDANNESEIQKLVETRAAELFRESQSLPANAVRISPTDRESMKDFFNFTAETSEIRLLPYNPNDLTEGAFVVKIFWADKENNLAYIVADDPKNNMTVFYKVGTKRAWGSFKNGKK